MVAFSGNDMTRLLLLELTSRPKLTNSKKRKNKNKNKTSNISMDSKGCSMPFVLNNVTIACTIIRQVSGEMFHDVAQ